MESQNDLHQYRYFQQQQQQRQQQQQLHPQQRLPSTGGEEAPGPFQPQQQQQQQQQQDSRLKSAVAGLPCVDTGAATSANASATSAVPATQVEPSSTPAIAAVHAPPSLVPRGTVDAAPAAKRARTDHPLPPQDRSPSVAATPPTRPSEPQCPPAPRPPSTGREEGCAAGHEEPATALVDTSSTAENWAIREVPTPLAAGAAGAAATTAAVAVSGERTATESLAAAPVPAELFAPLRGGSPAETSVGQRQRPREAVLHPGVSRVEARSPLSAAASAHAAPALVDEAAGDKSGEAACSAAAQTVAPAFSAAAANASEIAAYSSGIFTSQWGPRLGTHTSESVLSMPKPPRLEPMGKLDGAGSIEKPFQSPLPERVVRRSAGNGGHQMLAEALLLSSRTPVSASGPAAAGVIACPGGGGQPKEVITSGGNACAAAELPRSPGPPKVDQEDGGAGAVTAFGRKDNPLAPVRRDSPIVSMSVTPGPRAA